MGAGPRRPPIKNTVVVLEPTEDRLNERQLVDYRDFRERLIKWVLHLGKEPKKADGYVKETTRRRSYRIDQFYRWIWEEEDGYTLKATPTHAEEYSKELAYSDYSNTHKAGFQKFIKTLFKFQRHEQGKMSTGSPQSSSLTILGLTMSATSSHARSAGRSKKPFSNTAAFRTTMR